MRVAIYCRVSADDQAEKGTIQNQVYYLRARLQLDSYEITGEYLDDAVTGTTLLGDRPQGKRLIADAHAKRFEAVWIYRVDRLARSLTTLLDAEKVLTGFGVTIKSATEPFDTETAVGKFLFQMLGSLAELERQTI